MRLIVGIGTILLCTRSHTFLYMYGCDMAHPRAVVVNDVLDLPGCSWGAEQSADSSAFRMLLGEEMARGNRSRSCLPNISRIKADEVNGRFAKYLGMFGLINWN